MRLRPHAPVALRFALLSLLPLLAGCGNTAVERTFGIQRNQPDAFLVTTQAPLAIPPSFALPPPPPGEARPPHVTPRAGALAALAPTRAVGAPSAGGTSMSPGQAALLRAAGPAPAPGIRHEVNAQAAKDAGNTASLTDRLMFWAPNPKPGIVLNPAKEAQRLRENAALGKSAEHGNTPIIQPHSKGLLTRLLDSL